MQLNSREHGKGLQGLQATRAASKLRKELAPSSCRYWQSGFMHVIPLHHVWQYFVVPKAAFTTLPATANCGLRLFISSMHARAEAGL